MLFKDITSVSSTYAKSLLQAAAQQGCDVDAVLRELNISRAEIDDELRFSAAKYGQLYQRVMWVMQDECFGMFSGGKVPLGAFRLMCLAVLHCTDLQQAIVRAGEFSEICRGMRVRSRLEVDTEQTEKPMARVKMAPIKTLTESEFQCLQATTSPNRIRTSLAVWHRFNCWLIGCEIPLGSLHFTFPCPEEFKVLAESYPASLKFDQTFNGFEFPAEYLDYAIVQDQETLMDFLRTAPYHLVINDYAQNTVKAKVRAILSKDVSHTMPSAEEVASRLNLSVTSLRRKLQSESTSYQKLKDECRMEAAFHYLGCPDFTNSTIAQRLGFDESSAFFRAFKKWTGITPGEYRKGLQQPCR